MVNSVNLEKEKLSLSEIQERERKKIIEILVQRGFNYRFVEKITGVSLGTCRDIVKQNSSLQKVVRKRQENRVVGEPIITPAEQLSLINELLDEVRSETSDHLIENPWKIHLKNLLVEWLKSREGRN